MSSPKLYKYWDSYVLYIPTVHAFGSVSFTHTLLVQTHPHVVSVPLGTTSAKQFVHIEMKCFFFQEMVTEIVERKINKLSALYKIEKSFMKKVWVYVVLHKSVWKENILR